MPHFAAWPVHIKYTMWLFQDFHVTGDVQEPSVKEIHPDKTVPGEVGTVFSLLDIMQYMRIAECGSAYLDLYGFPGKQ